MKNIKILTITTVLLAICLTACNINDIAPETTQAETNENRESSSLVEPIGIFDVEDGDFKRAILEEINLSKTISGDETQGYANHRIHKISDIEEFYIPNIEIEGFELRVVGITEREFYFQYSPINPNDEDLDMNGNYMFDFNSGVLMSIERPESWFNTSDSNEVFEERLEQVEQQGWGQIKDNIIYSENLGYFSFQMNNTIVKIRVLDSLNNYEYLRDLALQVINSAELVNVEHELSKIN